MILSSLYTPLLLNIYVPISILAIIGGHGMISGLVAVTPKNCKLTYWFAT